MDYAASRRVQQLITTLTDPKASTLDADKLAECKALLKQSEALVAYGVPLLIDRLGASHSQARKLCVEVFAVLFNRSRCFRQLLCQQFTTFVELTVGHRPDLPLPGPPAAAQALRARALEVVEEWHQTWGTTYPQVTVAYRYLQKQYKFPEIASRAAAAAAEAAARMQRHHQLLLQRYTAFKADFPQQRGQVHSLIQQIQECFKLLNEQPQQQVPQSLQPLSQQPEEQLRTQAAAQQQPQQPDVELAVASAAAAAGEAALDEQWEDVPAAAAAGDTDVDDGVTLADDEMDELIGDYYTGGNSSGVDAELAARNASLLAELSDLCRQAALAARRPLLDWLRLLTQVQPQQQPQPQQQQRGLQQWQRGLQQWQQERQSLLQEVVRLRAQLQALIEEAANTWGVTQSAKRSTAAAADTSDPAAAAAPTGAGGVGAGQQDDRDTTPDLSSLPSRAVAGSTNIAQQQQPAASGTAHHLTLGSNLQRLQQQQQQSAAARPAVRDPYAQLRDPTLAVGAYTIPQDVILRNEQLKFFSSPPDLTDQILDAADSSAAAAPAAAGGSSAANRPAAGSTAQRAAGAQGSGTNRQDTATQAQAGSSSGLSGRKRPAQGSNQGSSKTEVLKKLAAAAPQLPISGEDWLLAEYGVNQHGMELYNHWGAVDANVGLSKERFGQLMGYAASYYAPTQQQPPKRPAAPAAAGAVGNKQPRTQAAGAVGVGQPAAKQTMPAPALTAGPNPAANTTCAPTPTAAAAVARPHADSAAGGASRTGPAGVGVRQEGPVVTVPAEGRRGTLVQQREQQPQRQMSRREAASAHNRAVLAGAFTDQGMAAALQQQLDAEAAAEAAEKKKGKAKKAPERKVDKIRKHLFS